MIPSHSLYFSDQDILYLLVNRLIEKLPKHTKIMKNVKGLLKNKQ